LSKNVQNDVFSEHIGQRRQAEEWFLITQDRIDMFADATEDHQYIHVDPERARKRPFGSTVAHGFLTLSLLPKLLETIQFIPENVVMGVNYGLNRLRFPHPVPVNSNIRASTTLREVSEMAPGRFLLTSDIVIEIKGIEKPAMVAESLAMWVLGNGGDAKPAP
jgi:acyl dehydratase